MTEPLDVATQYYAGLDRIDAAGVAALLRPDVKVEVPGATFTSPEQFQGWMQVFFDAFPDITHTNSGLEVDGDTVQTDLTIKGTHTGPLVSPQGAVPPTGRSLEIHAHNVMHVDGDRIAAIEITFDPEAMPRQLGLL